ncbi:MAG: tRNA (adenosine(37)-N6)-dimethylallyltransferase MiaA [Simkaniaceae bacterium]|nr:tRNA (adenosine(37)-N6)-dimethylallyltransferase MiaA [Candidatus Sacchlamyda saccharinae]
MNPTTSEQQELEKLLSKIPLPLKQKTPNQNKKPKVIVISGPTAVGKTKLSLAVAQAIGGEIISADSMQVYRGMDIGTAKVTEEERKIAPHHLIDIRNLEESFNVMDFYKEAHKAIKEVLMKGGVPIVVGGTGFYIHALIYGPPAGPPSVPEVRKDIEDQIEKQGTDALFEKLKGVDPDYAKTITGADRQKIVRALEIISLTNKKVSDFPKMESEDIPYDFRCWFLYAEKAVLYPHIEMRCDEMISKGFIEEVRELEKKGLRKNSSASQAIGYRQCLDFLAGEGSPDDFEVFVSAFKRASRRYAKRQFTWFKKEPLFRWLSIQNVPLEKSVETICQDYELSF